MADNKARFRRSGEGVYSNPAKIEFKFGSRFANKPTLEEMRTSIPPYVTLTESDGVFTLAGSNTATKGQVDRAWARLSKDWPTKEVTDGDEKL